MLPFGLVRRWSRPRIDGVIPRTIARPVTSVTPRRVSECFPATGTNTEAIPCAGSASMRSMVMGDAISWRGSRVATTITPWTERRPRSGREPRCTRANAWSASFLAAPGMTRRRDAFCLAIWARIGRPTMRRDELDERHRHMPTGSAPLVRYDDAMCRAIERRSAQLDCMLDHVLQRRRVRRGQHHAQPQRRTRAGALADHALDLPLRGHPDLLEELAQLDVETAFVHGALLPQPRQLRCGCRAYRPRRSKGATTLATQGRRVVTPLTRSPPTVFLLLREPREGL